MILFQWGSSSGVDSCGNGFGGDVELDVIGIAVEMEAMSTYDVSKGEHVEDDQEMTKHWILEDALAQRSCGGGAVVDADELLSVCEVRF